MTMDWAARFARAAVAQAEAQQPLPRAGREPLVQALEVALRGGWRRRYGALAPPEIETPAAIEAALPAEAPICGDTIAATIMPRPQDCWHLPLPGTGFTVFGSEAAIDVLGNLLGQQIGRAEAMPDIDTSETRAGGFRQTQGDGP
jgi:hypothetical protein